MKARRILACAFSCCPPGTPGFRGGEDILGWNLLNQIARFHEVWALTHGRDRFSIEIGLREQPGNSLHFCFIDLPRWLQPLLKIQGGHQLYYYLWQIKAYFVARRLLGSLSFDLFHHITYANDWMASFIGALAPIPYVRGPGGGAHRTPKGFEREYPLISRLWEKLRAPGQWLFRHDPFFLRGQSRASALLVCNRESMSCVPRKWSHKVHFFPVNGISSRDVSLNSKVITEGSTFRVLAAGSLIRVKGFSLAIKAYKEFAANHSDAEFSIVGSGPEEQRLRAIARKLQVHDKVRFVGALPRDELLAKMASHDVFLFPSLRDGGGAVVIEAMAAGKPVVCLDTGGPGMHVTEECGVKIAPTSPERTIQELSQALERLYLDRDFRERLGRAARERAQRHYHWDRLGERLMGIYQQALGNSHSG